MSQANHRVRPAPAFEMRLLVLAEVARFQHGEDLIAVVEIFVEFVVDPVNTGAVNKLSDSVRFLVKVITVRYPDETDDTFGKRVVRFLCRGWAD